MKSEVYSWRLSTEKKMALEREAREAGITLSQLLDRMASDWLQKRRSHQDDEAEQARLHASAAEFIGSISTGPNINAENVREIIREKLRKKHESSRSR